MRTSLRHSSAVDHKDLVGILDRGEAMRDGDDGLAVSQSGDGFLDQVLSGTTDATITASISSGFIF